MQATRLVEVFMKLHDIFNLYMNKLLFKPMLRTSSPYSILKKYGNVCSL